ncbi:METHYL-CPG BINDING PROTEIN MBD [Salix viminalis]|uniref:METHYL-CPG BINDING PROTEIN MBD n=1 Tax=Salix viminalis TaxID=40686 RepID=A0A9Q0NJ41_SALVM|nr:METHYL-CPG BINDING PROTEIN MBD [Salix viminalis]
MIGSSSDAAAANAATAVAITTRSGKTGYCFGDRGMESNTRYLTEHGLEHHSPNNDQYPFGASAASNGKLEKHQKADEAFLVFCRSLFDLPNGWVVERKPCKNIDYAGIIDKHYDELETGKLFRSLRSVEKDLTEGKKHIVTLEALKAEDHFIPFESSGSQKEHVCSKKVETAMLDPSSIPARIKWVLGGPGGIVWSPFMDDHLVPGFIKQKWLIEDVMTDSWQHASGAAWKSRA